MRHPNLFHFFGVDTFKLNPTFDSMDLNSKRILCIIIVPSPVVNRVGVSASGNFETILTLSVVIDAVTKEANAEELVLTSRLIEVSVEMCLFLAAAVSRLVSIGLHLDGYE